MLGVSPSQAVFGRDMLFDVTTTTDWGQQQTRKEAQIRQANDRENAQRMTHEYLPGDMVMAACIKQRAPKLQPLYEDPFPIISVRSNGIVVVDKERYAETLFIRRIKPFKPPNMGEDVVQD
ncbi:unnamed protein product [Phytophthora fragariaefolia]|uniref:Unnamed protein product n=1 Tax=Phytophthora fragariaefolia TaxID=1490495 RepID=A0A9W6Y8T3_9STRA|nr:unnamed protein product [Phytophthora fragariaefolia]